MASVYIACASADKRIERNTKELLEARGHEVVLGTPENHGFRTFGRAVVNSSKDVELFVPIITSESAASDAYFGDIARAVAYIDATGRGAVLPIVVGRFELEGRLREMQHLKVLSNDPDQVAEEVADVVDRVVGRRIAHQEEARVRRQAIESSAADFVRETESDLKSRERYARLAARGWHVAGYGALTLTLTTAGLFWWQTEDEIAASIEVTSLIAFSLKTGLLIAVLLSMSRYAFLQAKGCHVEALKNADRLHAIGFGKFYLKVFGDQVEKDELREVFQHWNTYGENDLTHLQVEKVDAPIRDAMNRINLPASITS